jgi:hypothetical protein
MAHTITSADGNVEIAINEASPAQIAAARQAREFDALSPLEQAEAIEQAHQIALWTNEAHRRAAARVPAPSMRMLKVSEQDEKCAAVGYTVRMTRKWLDEFGAPICPACRNPLVES